MQAVTEVHGVRLTHFHHVLRVIPLFKAFQRLSDFFIQSGDLHAYFEEFTYLRLGASKCKQELADLLA